MPSARAISSRRWSPYGQVLGQLVVRALQARRGSSSSRARTRAACLLAPLARRREQGVDQVGVQLGVHARRARSRAAVMFWNRRMFWNVRPMPASTMSLGRALRKIAEPRRSRWYQAGRMIAEQEQVTSSMRRDEPTIAEQPAARIVRPRRARPRRAPRISAGRTQSERLEPGPLRAARSCAGRGTRPAGRRVDDARR